MRKLKLDLNALQVTTFATDEAARGIGTVLGRVDHAYDTKAACPPETGSCHNYDTCYEGCATDPATVDCTAGITICVVFCV